MVAFCMKCMKEIEIKNPQKVNMRNGRPATEGLCPSCGKKVFKIGKS